MIVALMGAGLKIDRPLNLRSWGVTWRLLGVVMPLTIVATTFLGWWVIGLAPASALLLGAVLAPTDPVLAADVQVGAPGEGSRTRCASASLQKPVSTTAWPFPLPIWRFSGDVRAGSAGLAGRLDALLSRV